MTTLKPEIITKKPLIMGVLNFTPDSFSDGGKFNNLTGALKHALKMIKDGADIIDLGGESSGPGSSEISIDEELSRVIPVLKKIRENSDVPVSIDTYKSTVATQALSFGANMINDVTALRGDENMVKTAAKFNCPIVFMYSKDSSARTTVHAKRYSDIIGTIKKFWNKQIKYATSQGVKKENIILDPGMGQFISSLPQYSYEIILRLSELTSLDYPILVGISRKSFLGETLAQRDQLGLAPTALAIANGASIIRTHDVKSIKKLIECQIRH